MHSRSSIIVVLLASLVALAWAADRRISGQLTDTQNRPMAGATVRLKAISETEAIETISNSEGRFDFRSVAPGNYEIIATAPGFVEAKKILRAGEGEVLTIDLRFTTLAPRSEIVNVTADVRQVDIQHPDPAQQINVRQDILAANPGRPGAPVSIPGVPIETASSGIKAPQYFAPGVAGDHGEPIAQFFQVGSYLVPNNLSANAHGNGYSDPNVMVPAIIESVQTDGGSFNVREGDHSVNLASTYGFRQRVQPFMTLAGDYRDLDLVSGWSPADAEKRGWVAVEASYGNGFLDTLEHRQQYKINGSRVSTVGRHEITLFGIGYYGQSKIPGHAWQMVVSKIIGSTDFRLTLGRITQEQSLAKIDPDTGLQFDEGPGRNRYITIAVHHYFRGGLFQTSVSKADARDLSDGQPVPEAPRLIFDFFGTVDRLPFQLHACAEFEEVGRKPLGDGFISVPVREFRGALVRQFSDRLQVGINLLIAKGYTGQATAALALPSESQAA